jgi:trehalose 6-phosphate synthase/phosphatase
MNNFASDAKPSEVVDLNDVRSQVKALEEQHRTAGIPLSGRVLHVCHYLPITATLNVPVPSSATAAIPSPPASPPSKTADVDQPAKWRLAPRIGHSAMISGIRSLANTHEQVIIGWTGDLYAGTTLAPSSAIPGVEPSDVTTNPDAPHVPDHTAQIPTSTQPVRLPYASLANEDRQSLQEQLLQYDDRTQESDYNAGEARDRLDGSKGISLRPVFLEDKIAHGHYEGYCKASTYDPVSYLVRSPLFSSSVSHLPFPPSRPDPPAQARDDRVLVPPYTSDHLRRIPGILCRLLEATVVP